MTIARLSFAQQIESRVASTAKDSRSVNCYFESRGQNDVDNVKRPGLTLKKLLAAGTAQGMYRFNDCLIVVISNTVYKVTSALVVSNIGSISGAVNNVYFAESSAGAYLFLHNRTYGYTIDSGMAAVTIVDSTALTTPAISIGGTGYLPGDTITFAAPGGGGTTATGTLVIDSGVITGITMTNNGSGYAVGDLPFDTTSGITITTATGSNFVASCVLNGFPAGAMALAPGAVFIDGYTVVATTAGQVFNSAIENPTSWNPLDYITAEADPDKIEGIIKHLNYIVVFGQWGTEFFYDAANPTGSPFLRNDGFKSEIGTPCGDCLTLLPQVVMYVGSSKTHGKSAYLLDGVSPKRVSTRYIDKYLNACTSNDFQGLSFRIDGHSFYLVTMPSLDLTLVYDLDEQKWYQWTSYYSAAEHAFTMWTATEFNAATYGLHATNGTLYQIDPTVASDDSVAIYWRVITNRLDSGTMNRKFYKKAQIVGDKVSATMIISHSGDDYQTWSTARTVDLSKNTRSILYQCGWDRRRAWQFLVTDNVLLRFSDFEMEIEGGDMQSDPQMQQG